MSSWTEICISVSAADVDRAGDIANMAVPYGIYIEDYSSLEQDAWDIARIDLIDEELLAKDRNKAYVHIYISPEANPAEAVAYLEERYTAEGISYVIEQRECCNADWENNWKKYFKPIPVGERLLIHPVWEDEYDAGGRAVLEIEPGLAFGSGTHETTRLCLETLEKYVGNGENVLDIGCGSGILSVSSLLLGAAHADGVDIDALAVKTARENAERNGFTGQQATYVVGNLTDKISGIYDVVVANIVADVIIILAKDVRRFMKNGAVLIVSGIILPRENEVAAALIENGFEVIARHENNGWLCLEAK